MWLLESKRYRQDPNQGWRQHEGLNAKRSCATDSAYLGGVMKKKPSHLHCETYGQRVFFFYNWSSRSFISHMKKAYKQNWQAKDNPSHDDVGGMFQVTDPSDNQDDFIVWVAKGSENPHDALIHELVHLKNAIFKHIGHKLDVDNDEAEAYYMQRLHKFVREHCF
jgi:hypothetical protein